MWLGGKSKRVNKEEGMQSLQKHLCSFLPLPVIQRHRVLQEFWNWFSALLPEVVCFLSSHVWDVVFLCDLLRMSDFYDLWRDFSHAHSYYWTPETKRTAKMPSNLHGGFKEKGGHF